MTSRSITSTIKAVFAPLLGLSFLLGMTPFAHAASPDFNVYSNTNTNTTSAGYVSGEVVFRYQNDSIPFRIMHVPDVAAAVTALSKNPNIEFVEPNFIASAYSVPNDPYYQPYQWNFDNPVYGGIHAQAAWDTTAGDSSVVVAVVDTGVAYENYSSGRGRAKTNYSQAPDLAGTCFVPGYDFVNNDSHPNDDNAHGTHVAGTVAQTTNNNLGVAGLAHDTCIMPVKVLNSNGSGTYTQIANGIYYAVDNGADVISMSLGGASGSAALENAVAYAYNHGVTVIAAAGNSNGAVGYPAKYDNYVIAVGATRYDEQRASYSNYGPSLDLVAPGGDTSVDQNGDGYVDGILQQTFDPTTKNTSSFSYWFFDGTSMATPHVSAAAAMLIAHGNATTPDQVREALQSTADDLGLSGRDDQFGYGLINIPAALAWSEGPVDNPPSVAITNLSNGSLATGSVSIAATASDDSSVSEVRFYVDNVLIDTDTSAPYLTLWDSTSVSDGSHTIMATAEDDAGQTTSAPVTVTVDNVNDVPVANAGPDQNAYVGDDVVFSAANSSDDRGLVLFDWDFGDGSGDSNETTSHAYATAGEYTVTLTVTDADGVTDTDTATVLVSEQPTAPTSAAVESIDYITSGGPNADKHIDILPTVLDNLGNPVSGATVSLSMLLQGVSQAWDFQGVTLSDGTVVFSLKNAPNGCYNVSATVLNASALIVGGSYLDTFCK